MIEISVIVAAWNAAATLERCIASIAAQQGINGLEIIVVNDCSTDNTAAVIARLQQRYPNLIGLTTAQNGGPSAARNLGLRRASGEWIAVVDGDDALQPGRLARMLEHARSERLDICFDNLAMRQDAAPDTVTALLVPADVAADLAGIWSLELYAAYNMPYVSRTLLGFLKPLMNKAFLDKHRLGYRDELRNSEDFILITECLLRGARISYLDEPLYDYFIYGNSLSGRFNAEAHRLLMAAEQQLLAQPMLDGQREALARHLQSLQQAEQSNRLFLAIREKKMMEFMQLLWLYRQHAAVHLRRIAHSVAARLSKSTRRGR